MHNYKVATWKHVYNKKCEVAILAYFEQGGLAKQRGGPPQSTYSRGNTASA